MEKKSNIKTLIVEDESIVAIDIVEGLATLGYEVCGKSAVVLTEKQSPDVILMDMRLEEKMTGIEVAKEIYERRHIPIIFLTAHSDESTVQESKSAHPFGYLLKPFGIREIRAAIETALYKSVVDKRIFENERWNKR